MKKISKLENSNIGIQGLLFTRLAEVKLQA